MSKTIVVDASVVVEALIGGDFSRAAAERLSRIGQTLHAPVTIDAEVLHALRRRWVAKIMSDADARDAVKLFQLLPITRHPVQPHVDRIWSLRHNVTAYDAAYVALAETMDAPLLTRDLRLANSAGHTARIDYIA
jgi:predicted nucleic acid-binding protein